MSHALTAVLVVLAIPPTPLKEKSMNPERRSGITATEFELMKKSVLFGPDDEKALRMSREVLADQTDAVLDVWYGFIGANPQLVATFGDANGVPNPAYLVAVRKRFGQWILATAEGRYDQAWLDYQWEIGQRHFRTKKNKTDAVVSKSEVVPFRYLAPLVYPVSATLKPFLAKKGNSTAEVDAMHAAWLKSLLLQVTLWSHPYVAERDF